MKYLYFTAFVAFVAFVFFAYFAPKGASLTEKANERRNAIADAQLLWK